MTEQEFTELAEKHLTALQSYKMDKNGNFPIEIFGIEKLYKQLTLTDVVKSLPQDNYCNVCNLPTDGEKCYSKRCLV